MSAREEARRGPEFRTFRGPGFSLEVPDHWTDNTIYAFRGPAIRDFEPILCVQTEPGAAFATADDYARARLPLAVNASSGGRLLRREPMKLGSSHEGVFAEVRWSPAKTQEFYQRLLYAVFEDTGFLVSCHLTRHARAAASGSIHKVFSSFRPYGAAYRSSRPSSWIGDSFRLDLPPEWKDESLLLLAEPDATRFRRNVVVKRTPEPEAPDDLRPWADIEVGILKDASPGFELLEHRETTTADEKFAQKIVFLRDTEDGDKLRHTELAAWRDGVMYVMVATTELEPPRPVARMIEPMLRSLAVGTGTKA